MTTNDTPRPEAVGMPTTGATIVDTPKGIRVFQLISAKHAIGLEAKGLRHSKLSRQGGVRGLWAKHYGMPRRTPAATVIARIQQEINELTGQQELPL